MPQDQVTESCELSPVQKSWAMALDQWLKGSGGSGATGPGLLDLDFSSLMSKSTNVWEEKPWKLEDLRVCRGLETYILGFRKDEGMKGLRHGRRSRPGRERCLMSVCKERPA